jgi:hypothetical protein
MVSGSGLCVPVTAVLPLCTDLAPDIYKVLRKHINYLLIYASVFLFKKVNEDCGKSKHFNIIAISEIVFGKTWRNHIKKEKKILGNNDNIIIIYTCLF